MPFHPTAIRDNGIEFLVSDFAHLWTDIHAYAPVAAKAVGETVTTDACE
jgi:hypothetical protein